MNKTLPIMEARSHLSEISQTYEDDPAQEAVAITNRGKPVLAILSWELYESLVETLEILADKSLVRVLRQSLSRSQKGPRVDWKKFKQDLKL